MAMFDVSLRIHYPHYITYSCRTGLFSDSFPTIKAQRLLSSLMWWWNDSTSKPGLSFLSTNFIVWKVCVLALALFVYVTVKSLFAGFVYTVRFTTSSHSDKRLANKNSTVSLLLILIPPLFPYCITNWIQKYLMISNIFTNILIITINILIYIKLYCIF